MPQKSPVPTQTQPVALTIAGFDPSSGAGITADLQVFQAHGLFGVSAITALTVQSTLGVEAVEAVSGGSIRDTLKCLHFDLPPRGIKIGMLGGLSGVEAVADYVESIARDISNNQHIPIALDPVMQSSSGAVLLSEEALRRLCERLLPLIDWITPNWPELALLSGQRVDSLDQAEAAAGGLIHRYPALNLIVTGGDQDPPTDLVCFAGGEIYRLTGKHIESLSTHGTGCAFSTAFLSNLILQKPALEAAKCAKAYVAKAIRRAPGLGHGRGPLDLLWPLRSSR